MRMILTFIALGISTASQAGVPAGSIDDFIKREMPVSGVPGLTYAIVTDGAIGTLGARGVVRLGSDREVTPDTPFLTGSISKSFTALAVMQLVEAGRIDLDTAISHYLGSFSGRPAGAVTIRQLLSHTSGYSTLQGNTSRGDIAGHKDELSRRVDRLAEEAPAHSARARWEYSNANYQILGRLIEIVSGQEFQAYVEAEILEPVGMVHSFVADGGMHDTMATGHRPWFGMKRPLADVRTDRGTAPQGGIVASAGDLALYMTMMMNGEDDVLSAEGKATMMSPASDLSPFYGFGWFIDARAGTVWHSGTSPGFESLATMVPAEKRGVVVLFNAGSGTGFGETSRLSSGITARAIGLADDGESSRWQQKAMFVASALAPFVYLLSIVWAWRRREGLRAKTGAFGIFSLWFPLVTTLAGATVIFGLVPKLFGLSIGTLCMFQPDLGLALITTAVTGVLWAVFRLSVAYVGRSGPPGL